MKYQELELIIEFLYKGAVQVPENRLSNLIDAAQDLKVNFLLDLDGDSCDIDNIEETYPKTDGVSDKNVDTNNPVNS